MVADKATLPPPAPTEVPGRQLLGRKVGINVASAVTSAIATGMAYTALSVVIGIGLGAGVLHQAEAMKLATGIFPSSRDFVPPIGSVSSILLAAITLSVPVGALASGLAAYRSTKRWLTARLGQEG